MLIGNRGLLLAHGVAVPPIEVEAGFTAEGKELLYLSNFGSLSAGFVISYHADKQLRTQLRELEKVGIALMVHTTDPNITPARPAGGEHPHGAGGAAAGGRSRAGRHR